jgi:uncharacterized lipoprotein YmbA
MKRTSLCNAAALCVLCVSLAGCFGTSRPIEYFTLTPLPRPTGLSQGEAGAVLAVLPVAIPATIDRPQIVTRTAENQLALSEYNRWGGSLKEDIGRALVQNLNVLLAGRPVSVVPESLAVDPRYYVAVTVNRLDGRLGELVWLNAGWTLRDLQAKRTLAIRSFVAEERTAGPGFSDLVTTQSRLIEALSREIAAEFQRQAR